MILAITLVATALGCGKKETPVPQPTAIPTLTASPEPTGETGSLSNLEGDVQVLRFGSSDWMAATSGMKIGTGDGLKTGSDGYVLITFFDGSVMEVEADSEISVEDLSKDSGGSTTVRINQVLGNTINRVENLVDSSSKYEVETPAGSAVVRGTIFEMLVELHGHLYRTCVGTHNEGDGTEHSTDFTGGGVTVNVPEDKSSCCWEGGIPGQPFYSDPADDPLQYQSGDGYGYGVISNCTWNGTWCTDFGNIFLNQSGDEVMGINFRFDNASLYGGLFLGNVSGNMLAGWWFEAPAEEGEGNGLEIERLGQFEFTHWPDCDSFTGRWRECELPEGEGEPVCDGVWDEWSGERCPLCRSCPDFDALLNTPVVFPHQYHGDFLDVGGCRWYRVYLEKDYAYSFDICGGEFDIYGGGEPAMEIYNDDCDPIAVGSDCGEGGTQLSFSCPETGNYLIKVHEQGDDNPLLFVLMYYRLVA